MVKVKRKVFEKQFQVRIYIISGGEEVPKPSVEARSHKEIYE